MKLSEAVFQFEKKLVKEALELNKWNIAKVARTLGLSRSMVYQRIKKFGFSPYHCGVCRDQAWISSPMLDAPVMCECHPKYTKEIKL